MGLFKHKLNKSEILKWGILGGIAECIYIFLISLLIQVVSSKNVSDDFVWGGLTFILLLVISVVISAVLVFGKPTYLLLVAKQVRQAVLTFLTTLVTLIVVLTVLLFVIF